MRIYENIHFRVRAHLFRLVNPNVFVIRSFVHQTKPPGFLYSQRFAHGLEYFPCGGFRDCLKVRFMVRSTHYHLHGLFYKKKQEFNIIFHQVGNYIWYMEGVITG